MKKKPRTFQEHRTTIRIAKKARRRGWQLRSGTAQGPVKRDAEGKLPPVRLSYSLDTRQSV